MKRHIIFMLASVLLASAVARADQITVGLLSFDVFIPSSGTTPGVNAFDIFNFTGPVYGPTVGPPYAADPLTLDNASLTVDFRGGSSQVIKLGNIGPGELLDSSGNPVVELPSTDVFTSALFTATLSPASFVLSDGTAFGARAPISVDLTPSSGSSLVAGVDFAVVNATPIPEPNTLVLLGSTLIGIFGILRRKQRGRAVLAVADAGGTPTAGAGARAAWRGMSRSPGELAFKARRRALIGSRRRKGRKAAGFDRRNLRNLWIHR
jgi:hypothetical protein